MSKTLLPLVGIGSAPASRRRGALLIPPTGPGSVGDEAMILGLAAELNDRGLGPVEVFCRGGIERWAALPRVSLVDSGSGWKKQMNFLRVARRVARVYVIGADCLDGHYSVGLSVGLIRIAEAAAAAGAISTIVGSSLKETAHADALKAIASLDPRVRLCIRDPRSAERVRDKCARECVTVADAAFMLRPCEPTNDEARSVVAWMENRRTTDRLIVGVNFNRQVLGAKAPPEQVEALLDSFEHGLRAVLDTRPDVDMLFIPHDYRDNPSDRDHAVELADRLNNPNRARALEKTYRADELKWIAGKTDLVLTGRMHLAIASLGSGVPVACVTYQGKFEGLFDHFGINPVVLEPSAVDSDSLASLLVNAIDRRDALRQEVNEMLGKVRARSLLNLGQHLDQHAGTAVP